MPKPGFDDLCFLAGVGCVVGGVFWLDPRAGLIVLGFALLGISRLMQMVGKG